MRHRFSRTLVVLQFVAALAVSSVFPVAALAEPTANCDALAGDAIALQAIDAQLAKAACSAAIAASPSDGSLKYDYARALERDGDVANAKRLYQWAIDDGYAAAEAALAKLTNRPPQPAVATDISALQRNLSDLFAGLSDVSQRYLDQLPADPTDETAILAEVGDDPAALLNWVKTNTQLIPYRGVLRGPRGVLMDHSGNSLDRSLLLASLVQSAGYDVRLANATLTAEQARFVLTASSPAGDVSPEPETDVSGVVTLMKSDPRIPADLIDTVVAKWQAEAGTVKAEVTKRAQTVGDALVELTAGDAAARTARLTDQAIAAVEDHWWVQYQRATGWADLDPAAPASGAFPAAATITINKLDEGLQQTVTLRVIAEIITPDGASEQTLLSRVIKSSEVIDQPIELYQRGLSMKPFSSYLTPPDYTKGAAALRQAVIDERGWMPFLSVGGTLVFDRFVTSQGETPAGTSSEMAKRGLGSSYGPDFAAIEAALGTVFDDEAPPATPEMPFTAEWIDFEIAVPGAAPTVIRRQIFDLRGPAARAANVPFRMTPELAAQRALALVESQRIMIFGATMPQVLVERIGAQTIENVTSKISELLKMTAEQSAGESLGGPVVQSTQLAYARVRTRAGPVAAISRPNIVILRTGFQLSEGANLVPYTIFDVVENARATPGLPSTGALTRLGVVDTIAEGAALGSLASPSNTAARHYANLTANKPWTRIDLSWLGQPASSALDPDTRARLVQALADGAVVVVPEDHANSDAVWWRIDPATGAALGIGKYGFGADIVEEGMTLKEIVDAAACSMAGLGFIVSIRMGEPGLWPITGAMCIAGGAVHGAAGYALGAAGILADAAEIGGAASGGHGEGPGAEGGGESGPNYTPNPNQTPDPGQSVGP